MKKIHIHIIGLLSILIFCIRCESFIELDLPDSQLTGDAVFSDVGTAESAMAYIYSKLRDNVLVSGNSSGISVLLGTYTDEFETYSSSSTELQFYQNSLIAINPSVNSLWKGSYNLIYAINSVIEGLENSTTINENDKNRLLGEALFLRAYIHFYLTNLFGEIPYVISTDYTINASIGKLSESQIYTLLINDLELAKSLFTTNNHNQLKTRPDIETVKALLARVYLYNDEWELAKIEATSVIESGSFSWVESLDNVFLKNSTGTIWQLKPNQEGLPTLEGQNFIFTLAPPPVRALSMNLIDSFEQGDMRNERWVGSVTGGTGTYYYPHKYKQNTNGVTSDEYSILFRLEEMFLIRAEARVYLGDLNGAKNDLNKIRNRALLTNTAANIEQELIDAILNERKIEFFSELGHRFFDLKRTGKITPILSSIKSGWDTTDILLPIPESELLLNSNLLPQNPGY